MTVGIVFGSMVQRASASSETVGNLSLDRMSLTSELSLAEINKKSFSLKDSSLSWKWSQGERLALQLQLSSSDLRSPLRWWRITKDADLALRQASLSFFADDFQLVSGLYAFEHPGRNSLDAIEALSFWPQSEKAIGVRSQSRGDFTEWMVFNPDRENTELWSYFSWNTRWGNANASYFAARGLTGLINEKTKVIDKADTWQLDLSESGRARFRGLEISQNTNFSDSDIRWVVGGAQISKNELVSTAKWAKLEWNKWIDAQKMLLLSLEGVEPSSLAPAEKSQIYSLGFSQRLQKHFIIAAHFRNKRESNITLNDEFLLRLTLNNF